MSVETRDELLGTTDGAPAVHVEHTIVLTASAA
jgi:hypothetical protein